MKPILNKWQFVFRFFKRQDVYMPNLYGLQVGIFNIISLPEEGCLLGKKDYKGFILYFNILLPITINK